MKLTLTVTLLTLLAAGALADATVGCPTTPNSVGPGVRA